MGGVAVVFYNLVLIIVLNAVYSPGLDPDIISHNTTNHTRVVRHMTYYNYNDYYNEWMTIHQPLHNAVLLNTTQINRFK